MENNTNIIPIFFAIDDGYIPYLAVALQSLVEKSSKENYYLIRVLHTNISESSKEAIKKYNRNNVSIEFVDLNYYIEKIKDKLYTRDYYTKSTYFRLFLPELYPQYNKVLYLDSDIVLLDDVANLYNIDMGDNLVAAVPDDIIQNNPVFQEYVEKVVGVATYKTYFNAGVLLMNLDELRKFHFQDKFLYLLGTVKYIVVQDQDYLNRLCKGRVKLLDSRWNTMPLGGKKERNDLRLIHYNYVYKPWHYDNILYEEIFWEVAKRTQFNDIIKKSKANYTEDQRFKDRESDKALRALAQKESDCVGDDRRFRLINQLLNSPEGKAEDRLKILSRIQQFEEEGAFDVDPEDDPPTETLMPEDVDYLNKKSYSKLKSKIAYKIGERYLNGLLKENKLIIKEIKGLENLQAIKTGAIVTCNHFNPFDCFSVEKAFRMSGQSKNKKFFKVIREGNYTNFPGLYGFFFRNCDTLPLSSNKRTMIEFMKAVDTILQRGDFILIYPEQSMWWNYRKPKPLKIGAFKLAARNNVPVIPIFITMEDSKIIGDDGFPVQEYTINIEKPIYPNEKLSEKENANNMKDKNYEVWKTVYEDFYKMPLVYTTIKNDDSEENEEDCV